MKIHHVLIACALAMPCITHAGSNAQGPHGGIAAARGMAAARAAASAAQSARSGAPGNGGSYWAPDPNASLVDNYQPWPESEMRRFQKP